MAGPTPTWGVANGCQTSTPPPGALISDFEVVDGGSPVIALGDLVTFKGAGVSWAIQDGAWQLDGDTIDSSFGLVFHHCVDARAYDGISFTITGWGAICMPSFASVDTAHAAAGGVFPDGSGPPEAQPPEYYYPILYPPEVDRTVKMTLRFPFDAPGSQILSNPSPNPTTPTDPSRLVGLRWNIYGVATEACAVNSLSIDDVMFYKDPPDGGQDAPPDTSSGD